MRMGKITRFSTLGLAAGSVLVLLLPGVVAAQDAQPLPGEATTEPGEADPEGEGPLDIVDVRIGTHDGFDRVTFEAEGDGQLGWFVGYQEDPVSDGKGDPIEFQGEAAFRVVLYFVDMQLDTGEVRFSDDVTGPEGSIVNEVVNDLIFEGNHTFVIGLDEEVPYRIARLDDPSRVVIDFVHDTVPVGPVDAGFGGAAMGSAWVQTLVVLGGFLLFAGAALLVRRRVTAR